LRPATYDTSINIPIRIPLTTFFIFVPLPSYCRLAFFLQLPMG
jgi:hypothetical protein